MGTYHIVAKIKAASGGGMKLSGTAVATNYAGTFRAHRIPQRPRIGMNLRRDATLTTADNQTIANIFQTRNFRCSRMAVRYDDTTASLATVRDLLGKLRAVGCTANEVGCHISYQDTAFNSSAWALLSNLSAIELDSYSQTYRLVDYMKDLATDFEFYNEIQNWPVCTAEVVRDSAQGNPAPYRTSNAYSIVAASLKGMYRALKELRASSGLPLRAILGLAGRDWGFFHFMREQNVDWDVTGVHIYPNYNNEDIRTDTWWGAGGHLNQANQWGKPVTWNECNADEIYSSTYVNTVGGALTEQGFQSITKTMREAYSQSDCTLENLILYELRDNPSLTGSESRFGFMFDLNTPKVALYIATAFAGGTLNASEQSAITSRGLMSAGEISAIAVGVYTDPAAPPPAPPPPPPSESPHNSTIPPLSQIVDSNLATWTVSAGVVYKNSVAAGFTANVTELLYYTQVIYQKNSAGLWWSWNGTDWVATVDPRVGIPPMPSITTNRHPGDMLQVGNPATDTYWITDDRWGAGSLVEGSGADQYMQQVERQLTAGPNGEIAFRTIWRWPTGTTEVKGYPGIIYGAKPGIQGPDIYPGWVVAVRLPDGASVTSPPAGAPIDVTSNWEIPGGSVSTVAPSGATPGSDLPKKLPLSVGTLLTTGRYSLSCSGRGHLAFDIWLQASGASAQVFGFTNSPITHEIMIPLRNWGDYGRHGVRDINKYSHDTTIDGVTYHVYCFKDLNIDDRTGSASATTFAGLRYNFSGLNGNYTNEETGLGRIGWKFIIFQHDGTAHPLQSDGSFSIDISKFLNHLNTVTDSRGIPFAQGNEHVVSVELGVEPVEGSGDVTVWDYRTRVPAA